MVYPRPFLRLVVSGSLFINESFSWSLSLVDENDFTGDAPTEVPAGVISAVQAFHTTSMGIGAPAVLRTIKLNRIGVDGRYMSDGDTVLHDFDPGVPGVGTGTCPPQTALAITLRTAATRGRAASGRFFIPFTVPSTQGDGVMTTGAAQTVATAATTLLNSLNAAVEGHRVGVTSDIGTGTQRIVTHVEVGRVIDTIRSRRRSLEEARIAGAPLAP